MAAGSVPGPGATPSTTLSAKPKKLDRLMPRSAAARVHLGDQPLGQIDVHPLRRIGRRHAHHHEGEEGFRPGDGIERGGLGHLAVLLRQSVDDVGEPRLRLLHRLVRGAPGRDAVRKIRQPDREGLLLRLFEDRRGKAWTPSGAPVRCVISHINHACVNTHTITESRSGREMGMDREQELAVVRAGLCQADIGGGRGARCAARSRFRRRAARTLPGAGPLGRPCAPRAAIVRRRRTIRSISTRTASSASSRSAS